MRKNELKVRRVKDGSERTFQIENNYIYHYGTPVYCACTGNTEETATQMMWDGEKIYCPVCHEHKVDVLETYDDFLKKKELENQKKLENLHVVCAGEDWECGLRFYTLSARLDYEDWLKVKKYFRFYERGWSEDEELEFDFEPCGWMTRDGYHLQQTLHELGLIKESNLREFEDWEYKYIEV